MLFATPLALLLGKLYGLSTPCYDIEAGALKFFCLLILMLSLLVILLKGGGLLKVTSRKSLSYISLYCMILVQYVSYSDFLNNLHWDVNEKFISSAYLLGPSEMISYLSLLYKEGYHALGVYWHGLAMFLFFLAEFVFMMTLAYLVPGVLKQAPFSNQKNQWYQSYELHSPLAYVRNIPLFKSMLAKDVLEALESLRQDNIDKEGAYTHIELYYEKEESLQYISISNRMLKPYSDEYDVEQIVDYLTLSKEEAKELIRTYGLEAYSSDFEL